MWQGWEGKRFSVGTGGGHHCCVFNTLFHPEQRKHVFSYQRLLNCYIQFSICLNRAHTTLPPNWLGVASLNHSLYLKRSSNMKRAALVLSPLFLSFVIYHWGDEFQISITRLLNIDGSSKSLTRSRQGRGGEAGVGNRPLRLFAGPSFTAAQPSSGIQPGRGVTVPNHSLPQLQCDLLMSRQGHSPEHLLLSYISIRKKRVENFLIMHYVEQPLSTVRDVSIIMTALQCEMITEIFNWVSVDLVCVRTDRRWRD